MEVTDMLPLDILDKSAKDVLKENGISPESIDAAVFTDLDRDKKYCSAWLAFSKSEGSVFYFSTDGKIFEKYDLRYCKNPLVESFLGSVRFVYNVYTTEAPVFTDDTSEEEKKRLTDEYDKTASSVIVCYSTNKAKKKIFTLVDVIDRMYEKGEDVTEDDEIFKQYKVSCPKCGNQYPDPDTKHCPHCDKDKKALLRVFSYYRPHIVHCLIVLFCMLLNAANQLITPFIQNKFLLTEVLDENGSHHSLNWVFITIGAIVGLSLLNMFTDMLQYRSQAIVTNTVTDSMRKDIFAKIQTLSLSFFGKNSVGNILTRIDSDAARIAGFFVVYIPNTIWNTVNLIGMLIIVFTMNWQMSLIILVPVPFLLLLYRLRAPKYYRAHSKVWRAESSLNGVVNDSLSGIRVVKAFAKEVDETHRYQKKAEKVSSASIYRYLMYMCFFPIIGLLIGLASQVIWGIGGIVVINKYMTYADFVTYFSYIGLVFGPINFFTSNLADALSGAINSAQRFYETMDTKPDVVSDTGKVKIDKFKGEIELQKVNFSYTPNRPILKNVSLHINPGDQVGLVGHTGAGKSTIANLITRLYEPSSGKILIDGIDIRDIETASLRKNMAIVSQEIFIFRGTIADNIRYARPDATMDEVIAAAKAANAHNFIMDMPRGYDTVVGIGSSRAMSGGEQQRISIARAILLAPSILILDEATAAMDTETERLIGKALEALVEGRTTLSIAHRLSTLKNCNMLHAIEGGEIAESGTHDELIRQRGIYYKLYKLQSEANKKIVIGE